MLKLSNKIICDLNGKEIILEGMKEYVFKIKDKWYLRKFLCFFREDFILFGQDIIYTEFIEDIIEFDSKVSIKEFKNKHNIKEINTIIDNGSMEWNKSRFEIKII